MGEKKKNKIEQLAVTEFSKRGNGLALLERSNSPAVLVEIPFTVPGDVILAKLLHKKGDRYKAELQEIITPSKDRVPARCVHFGYCGGCRYQQISYEHQLKLKESQVRNFFSDLLGPHVDFRPIAGCKEPWYYRNKMEYTFLTDINGEKHLGFIKEGSKGLVFDIQECHLANKWFIDALKVVKKWWEDSNIVSYRKNKGTLQTLTLREGQHTNDRMVILSVSGSQEWALQAKQIDDLVARLKAALEPNGPTNQLSIILRIKQVEEGITTNVYDMLLYGPGFIRETLTIQVYEDVPSTKLEFHIGSSDFFQPNPKQTEKFYSMALNIAKIPKDAVVYDLYCGTGTLGLCISKFVKQVIGIEFWPESAANARNNAKRNHCNNVTIFSGAVRHTLHQLPEQKIPPPDVVMVNPPRSGLDPEALRHLLDLSPPKILYVSCNPETQAQNVIHLKEQGYRLITVQPVDQFPQTSSIECVCVLVK